MKQYRLAYDCLFLSNDFDNGFIYKDEPIVSLAIYLEYRVFDKKTTKEVFFQSDELKDQMLEYRRGVFCYLNDFYKCFVDGEKGVNIIPNLKIWNVSDYIVVYEIGSCNKWSDSETVFDITYEEFIDILKNNVHEFENLDNKPTQSTAFYAIEQKVSDE